MMPSNPTFGGITKDEAFQFAIILSSGVPQIEAMRYLRPDLSIDELKSELGRWLRDGGVQREILRLQGKTWQDMGIEERIKFSIDKHYTELAYFLYSHNYSELDGPARNKADTCRQVLESKLAGLSGKMDAMSQFFDDLKSGKFNKTVQPLPIKPPTINLN